jgi:bacterioferritin
MQGDFVSDLAEIRRRARQHVEEGAVTPGYRANREVVLNLLNEALATELVCTLRYKRHYFMARGLFAETVAAEFMEHAREETEHGDRIAERIVQLGGSPDFNPSGLLSRSAAEYQEGETLTEMVKEDLIAERIAIDTYKGMIQYIGENDPTTRRMLEAILEKEEEHADDLANMIQAMGDDSSPGRGS